MSMNYSYPYQTPLGPVTVASNGITLTGLWFPGQKYDGSHLCFAVSEITDFPIFRETVQWLDAYWEKKQPSPSDLPISFSGSVFQNKIWQLLLQIPYGNCIAYHELAQQYCAAEGLTSMSAQAVGGAVGKNPISIIVPCHRVIGAHGAMTGYAGGIGRKTALLAHEGFLRLDSGHVSL